MATEILVPRELIEKLVSNAAFQCDVNYPLGTSTFTCVFCDKRMPAIMRERNGILVWGGSFEHKSDCAIKSLEEILNAQRERV